MIKGIIKNTVLESGAISDFSTIRDIKINIDSKDVIYTLNYYLDKNAFDSGLIPISTKEFIVDSGFVKQFLDSRGIEFGSFMYNLLNSVIAGTLSTD